jgi:hypothetical protein
LRLPSSAVHAPVQQVAERLRILIDTICSNPDLGCITDADSSKSADELMEEATRWLRTYHTRPVIERLGDRLHVADMKLLYYYANRTSHIEIPEGEDDAL